MSTTSSKIDEITQATEQTLGQFKENIENAVTPAFSASQGQVLVMRDGVWKPETLPGSGVEPLCFRLFGGYSTVKIVKESSAGIETAPVVYYSYDKYHWYPYTIGTDIQSPSGRNFNNYVWRVYFRGDNPDGFSIYNSALSNRYFKFDKYIYGNIFAGKLHISGNIMSLVGTSPDEIPCAGCFARLFKNLMTEQESGTGVSFWDGDLSDLELPATNLKAECYSQLFYGCTQLTVSPKLPAVRMDSRCYGEMFQGCTKLEVGPALRIMDLQSSCLYRMFKDSGSSLKLLSVNFKDSNVNLTRGYTAGWLDGVTGAGILITNATSVQELPASWSTVHNDYDAALEPASFAIPAASTAQLLLPPTEFSHAPSAATVYTLWHDPDKAVETVRIVVDMTTTNSVSFQDENGVAIPSGTWAVGSEVEFTCTYANGGWAVVGDDGSKGASQADVQSMIADALTMH